MKTRRTSLRKGAAWGDTQATWVSTFENAAAAGVEALENLFRTQFVLMFEGSEPARGAARQGRRLSGPYSSLLFSIVMYSAIWVFLNNVLDASQNARNRFAINDLVAGFSWRANVGLIVSVIVFVPLAGSVLSGALGRRHAAQRPAIRNIYIYAVSSFLWHLGVVYLPMFSWILARNFVERKASFIEPMPEGKFLLSQADEIIVLLLFVVLALRVAWIFERNVNKRAPRSLRGRILVYLLATVALPMSMLLTYYPINHQYLHPTDQLQVTGELRLVDAETIEFEFVFVNERKEALAIKSSDLYLELTLPKGETSSYPLRFYADDGRRYSYVVLESGCPAIVNGSVFMGRNPGTWPLDKYELAKMGIGLCVFWPGRSTARGSPRCVAHEIRPTAGSQD